MVGSGKGQGGEQLASASLSDVELIDGRVPNRIMLLPIGELQANDGRRWLIKDKAHAEEIISATRSFLGNRQMMVDYDHQVQRAPAVAGQAPAGGWVDPASLRVTDEGIVGDVEWTAAARSALREREYRYLSPYFGHRKDGRVTRIFNVALTNTPALDMPAVAASDLAGDETKMNKIIQSLGLAAGADEDAIVAAIDTLKNSTSLTAIASALRLKDGASQDEIVSAASAAIARPEVDLKPLAIALGAAEDANVEQLAAAAATLKAGVIDPAKYVPIETHQALQKLVDEDREEKATAAVDAAIAAGKIAPANRDFYLGSARKDLPAFTAFVSAAPVVLQPGEADAAAGSKVNADQLTDEERAVCASLGISEEQFLKTKKEEA